MKPDPIVRLRARILRIPTIREHRLSMATMRDQRTVLLEIETRDGLVGYGEAATIGGLAYAEESPDSICLTLEHYFAPVLEGRDSCRFGACIALIAAAAVGNLHAKMAVETALLDIAGKRAGLPLSELLGGRRIDRLEVAWALASGETDRDIEEGRRLLHAGRHRHFKLKIGRRDWQADVRHCAEIVAAFGDAATVRVDVNQAWDIATAKRAVPALAEAGVVLIEQPLPGHDRSGARMLRTLSRAAIMADEALRGGAVPAAGLARDGAADAFALKIGPAGGLAACRAVAEIGEAHGIGLYGGTMLEGPVATLASAHLFATLAPLRWGTELFGPLLLKEDILSAPLDYDAFGLTVPDGPGLGVELDPAVIGACAQRDGAGLPR